MRTKKLLLPFAIAFGFFSFGVLGSAGLEGLNGDNFALDATTTQAIATSIKNQLQSDVTLINAKLDSLGATVGGQSTAIAAASTPVGAVVTMAMGTAPNGYLICDGSAVSKTTYSALFAYLGTFYDTQINPTTGVAYSAPAAGTFRLPDYRGVFLRGSGTNNLGVATTVGGWQDDGTSKNGLLGTSTALSVFGSTDTGSGNHTHSFSGTTGSMNSNTSHSHGYIRNLAANAAAGSALRSADNDQSTQTSGVNIDHTHGFSGTTGAQSGTHTHSVTSTGSAVPLLGAGDTETRPQNKGVSYVIKY